MGRRTAAHGETGVCRYCKKSITLKGQFWLDADGVRRCEAGQVHSVSGSSAMPARLSVDPLGPDGSG